MNKSELVDFIVTQAELSKADATRALDAMVEGITSGLTQNGEVRLSGFGTFSVSARAARTGRNPKTGESIQIAASKNAKFKAAKSLQDVVNDNAAGGKKKSA